MTWEEWMRKNKEINREYTRRYKCGEDDILYSLCGCLYNWRSLNSSFQEEWETYMDHPMLVWRCKHRRHSKKPLVCSATVFRMFKFWVPVDANFTYRYYCLAAPLLGQN